MKRQTPQTGRAGHRPRSARTLQSIGGSLLLTLLSATWPATAQTADKPPSAERAAAPAARAPSAPVASLDALLFYQLLIGELELQNGRPAVAVEVLLDAARRSRDEALYQRAVEVAVQARSPEQALAAARAWRLGAPDSLMPLRYQVQLLAGLGRTADAAEPIRSLLARSSAAERTSVMASLPRLLVRGGEAKDGAELLEQLLQPYSAGEQREAALVSTGRGWLLAGDDAKALARAQEAARLDPKAPGPVLLALELLPRQPAAEALVTAGLKTADAREGTLRMAYARVLTQQQRLADAATQLSELTRLQPERPEPWLMLGAVELELKHAPAAEKALARYLEVAQKPRPDRAEADDADERADGTVQARLMLAQAAEMRGDYVAAERQLAQIADPARLLEVQNRRASMLVKQGRWQQARELISKQPEPSEQAARAKVMAEAQILREARQWGEAFTLLSRAQERFPRDSDLIYEQAMAAEKLNRLDEMERLLRQVIALKPDHQHAYNALGYSLADRGLRLPEARTLIEKALALAPGDPFITDSLGWLEFRAGRHQEALRLLRQAYGSRPDTEIGAHLGEVLWTVGERDEARRIWSDSRRKDASNEVLLETLKRLKPGS